MVTIRQLLTAEPALLPGLCDLLTDAVHGGASVGFLAPLATATAAAYWHSVYAGLGHGLCLWVAERDGVVVGTVQLEPSRKENGRHRAEILKLLVLRAARRQGIATRLMATAEAHALTLGRTLLMLDTHAGSAAEPLYQKLGWQRVGEIPDCAALPDGRLAASAYYYKQIGR